MVKKIYFQIIWVKKQPVPNIKMPEIMGLAFLPGEYKPGGVCGLD